MLFFIGNIFASVDFDDVHMHYFDKTVLHSISNVSCVHVIDFYEYPTFVKQFAYFDGLKFFIMSNLFRKISIYHLLLRLIYVDVVANTIRFQFTY